jgi:lysophospholipase L1-like esterase
LFLKQDYFRSNDRDCAATKNKELSMKKDWLLLIGSVAITLGIAVGIIRWLAPGLLGISPDLQLVKIDKKVPPFFENIFRAEDSKSQDYLIKDPVTQVRAIPLYPDMGGLGPNDLLGFRNRAIPQSAKIVTVGDSQTYGNNAVIERNWPGFLLSGLKAEGATLYNMSVGGWAAPQYLSMLGKALVFRPEVIIVAFYSGNDPMESFMLAYGNPYWQPLIPDKTLTAGDAPKATFPAPKEEQWPVAFKDGVKTVFTPTVRLVSNLEHPAVHAGYTIMADVARRIAESVANRDVKLFFTIIPTKELVYAKKVSADGLQAPQDYQTLVAREAVNIQQLSRQIQSYPEAAYVDVLQPLQQQAMQAAGLYPEDDNGHPVDLGYEVIGRVLAAAVKPYVSIPRRELVTLEVAPGQYQYLLLTDNGLYVFESTDFIESNGWPPGRVKTITQDELAGLPTRGVINEVNPALYGPLGDKKQ